MPIKAQSHTTVAVPNGYYYIQTQTIGAVGFRNIEYPSITDGINGGTAKTAQLKASLPQYNCGYINQQWEISIQSDGSYRIRPRANLNNGTSEGASVEAADNSIIKTWRNPTHTANRAWYFESVSDTDDSVFKIVNSGQNTVFDASDDGQLYHAKYSGKNSQHFKLIPVTESIGTPVNFMAYNLYFNVSKIATRAPRLKAVIDKYNPDVAGFSEVVPAWVTELSSSRYSNKYELVYKFRGGEIGGNEGTAILYNKTKYTLTASGHYWLSGTPHIESNTFGSACNRIITWVKLKDNVTNAEFYFHSVHADYLKAVQFDEAKIMIEIAATHGDADIIFGGDFNYEIGENSYNHFTSFMDDSRDTVQIAGDLRSTVPNNANFHDDIVRNALSGEYIDHFFTSSSVDTVYYTVMYDTPNNGYVSDHYGLYMQTLVGTGREFKTTTVNFFANCLDNVSNIPSTYRVKNGASITINSNPIRNGYVFMGWADSLQNAQNMIPRYYTDIPVTDTPLTLYAVWKEPSTLENGTYYIKKTIDSVEKYLQYPNTVNQQLTMTTPNKDNISQEWYFDIQPDGSYRIRPTANLNGASIDNNGGDGIIKTWSNIAASDNRSWYLIKANNKKNEFVLVSKGSGTVFEIDSDGGLYNGTISSNNQIFSIIDINTANPDEPTNPCNCNDECECDSPDNCACNDDVIIPEPTNPCNCNDECECDSPDNCVCNNNVIIPEPTNPCKCIDECECSRPEDCNCVTNDSNPNEPTGCNSITFTSGGIGSGDGGNLELYTLLLLSAFLILIKGFKNQKKS